ncbi:MAG: LysR family transcriptional regulator [Lachnoclostridium sp.]|jgi:DNA-binding transcriptional LysR family regulator|nr:LysR family transcriptional regulator [Lachnoclostridium sp.]
MTLKHIRVFVMVYQEASVTEAAGKLNMTQPAVSLAIRELEQHYGTKLFERYGRKILPSGVAKTLYEYASQLMSLYTEMDAEIMNWNIGGNLRIGCSISIGTCLVPDFMKHFKEEYPEMQTYVKIDSSDVIEEMILDNMLDFALIEGMVHSDKIKCESFLEDELVTICNKTHHLSDKVSVSLDELKEESFLLREQNSGTRELIEREFASHDIFIKPVWESTSTTAIINGVIAGHGISILPKRLLDDFIKRKQIVPLGINEINFKRFYNIIYHQKKHLMPAALDFFEIIRRSVSS